MEPNCQIENQDIYLHENGHQTARQAESVNVKRVNKHHKTNSININSQDILSLPSTNFSPLRKSVAVNNAQQTHILQRSLSNASLSPPKLQVSTTQLDLRHSMNPVQAVSAVNIGSTVTGLRRSISPTHRSQAQLVTCNRTECVSPQRHTQILTQHTQQYIPVQPVMEVPVMKPVVVPQQKKTEIIEKIVEKPIEIVKEVQVEKVVEKPVYYEKEIEKVVEVVKEIPGPVEYVEKVVEKPIYYENTDKIQYQEDEISELKKRLNKQPKVVEKPVYYEKEVIKEVPNPHDLETIRNLQLRNDELRRQLDDELYHHEETRKHHANKKPQIITKEIEKPVYIDKIVEKEVVKEIEKPVYIDKIVEKEILKEIEKPVYIDKIVEKEIVKEIEKPVYIKSEPIVKEIVKEVPVYKEIEKVVYQDKYVEVPVEKIVEKPVYIDKVIEKEVVREDHTRIHQLEMELESLRRQLHDERECHNETRKRKQKVPATVEKTVYVENQADLKLRDELEHWKQLCKSWKSKYDSLCETELEYKIIATRKTKNEHRFDKSIAVTSEECEGIDRVLTHENNRIVSHMTNGSHSGHHHTDLDSHVHKTINDYGISAQSKSGNYLENSKHTTSSRYSNGYSNGYNSHIHH